MTRHWPRLSGRLRTSALRRPRALWQLVLCTSLMSPCWALHAHSSASHLPFAQRSAAREPAQLRAEVARLEAEIVQLRAERRTRDVLGGLGMVAGLFGTGYYFAARRARRSR